MKTWKYLLILGIAFGTIWSCKKDDDEPLLNFNLNLYPVSRDVKLGYQMDSIIRSNPAEYPILNPTTNADIYEYIDSMFQGILASDEIKRLDKFDWELTIIDKDVMNAFACPGGKLYFYTGIMKYLDDAAGFAGVLAHEVAHSDRRHATRQMTKQLGTTVATSVLIAAFGGSDSQMGQVAQQMVVGLTALKFSRDDEYEADEYAVKYLADMGYYHPKGIARFFEQLEADGHTGSSFEFLSTHPSDDNRIQNIEEVWIDIGSPNGVYDETRWQQMIGLLP